MKIINGYQNIPPEALRATAVIGNFDGMHLGHQAIIKSAKEIANNLSTPLGVITFDPHPREYFIPNAPPFKLIGRDSKMEWFKTLGVDYVYELAFTEELAKVTAFAFLDTILHRALKLKHVIVGRDFCFGKDRQGTADYLIKTAHSLGFSASICKPVASKNGQQISSTRVRKALSKGAVEKAKNMLGHFHALRGYVVEGDKRGNRLGYPTANISLDNLHLPRLGIYACYAHVLSGASAGCYKAVTSIGIRPMFKQTKPTCETFIFNFHHSIYGESLSILLVHFLREEKEFKSIEDLVTQMQFDCIRARNCFAD